MRIACDVCGRERSHNHRKDPKRPILKCECGAVGQWTPFPGLPSAKQARHQRHDDPTADLDAGADLPEDLRASYQHAQQVFATKLAAGGAAAPGAGAPTQAPAPDLLQLTHERDAARAYGYRVAKMLDLVLHELGGAEADKRALHAAAQGKDVWLAELVARGDRAQREAQDLALQRHATARELAEAQALYVALRTAFAKAIGAREDLEIRALLAAAQLCRERADTHHHKAAASVQEVVQLRSELADARRECQARREDGLAIGRLASAMGMGAHEDADTVVNATLQRHELMRDYLRNVVSEVRSAAFDNATPAARSEYADKLTRQLRGNGIELETDRPGQEAGGRE